MPFCKMPLTSAAPQNATLWIYENGQVWRAARLSGVVDERQCRRNRALGRC